MHAAGDGADVADGFNRLLEAKPELGQAGLLLVKPLLGALLPEHFHVAEKQLDHPRVLLLSLFRQRDTDTEQPATGPGQPGSCGQALRQALGLELRQQAAIPFVPDQVAEVGNRFLPVVGAVVRDGKGQVQLPEGGLGLHLYQHGQVTGGKQRRGDLLGLVIPVGNRAEQRHYQGLQLVQGLGAQHDQPHHVGGIIGLVEPDQFIAHRGVRPVGQGFQTADVELAVGVLRVHDLLDHVQAAAGVALQAHLVLGFHRVLFPVHVGGIEPGRDEELGETVQRFGQEGGVDVEEVVGIFKTGVGVAGTAVLGDIALVLGGIRVLVGAQEQHVLQEVRQPGATGRVVAAAHLHVQ